jgi:hypothetical protein
VIISSFFGKTDYEVRYCLKRSEIVARGNQFNHKKKGHPGKFPKNSITEKQTKEAIGDEEFIVTQEAFKNRIEEEEVE